MPKQTSAIFFEVVIATIAWSALALQLYILIDNTPGNGMSPLQAIGRFFIFFTILSNLLVAICTTTILLNPSSSLARFFTRPSSMTAVSVYIFIVGLVYNSILRQLWQPKGLQQLADELLHVAVPVLFIVYWIFFVMKGSLKWKHSFGWLIFPLCYLVYAMTRGSIEGFYPYPFIDLNKLSYTRVMLNCLGLSITFLITGFLFIAIDKLMDGNKTTRL